MKKSTVKKPRQLVLKPAVKSVKSAPKKPRRVHLSKTDPDYFSKMGKVSAKRRKDSPEWSAKLSEWAKKGHANRDPSTYRGGRKKKTA